MRHPLGFEVEICDRATGAPFPELVGELGQRYVVASPGADFVVRVGVGAPPGAAAAPPAADAT